MYLGKLEVVKREMVRCEIPILGISELRWNGKGHLNLDDGYRIYFSGSAKGSRNGVAVICNRETVATVLGYHPVNERIMTIRFQARPFNLTIIQVYAPTSVADEEDVDVFYDQLQEIYDNVPFSDMIVCMGNFNAKVGANEEGAATGKHGLGTRNEAGVRLVDFCSQNNVLITNTCYTQPPRRLYTWTSPDGRTRNQIDYILISKRWRNSCLLTKTLPGAECGSDHQLLTAKLRLKLKRTQHHSTTIRYDTEEIPHLSIDDRQLFQ